MGKYLLIPDSFKGTMSSAEICSILKEAILRTDKEAQVTGIPVADGGEGSVEAFLSAVGGELRKVKVHGPYFEEMESFYGILSDGRTAVVEMAACAGLPLVGEKKNPLLTTTYGVGELLRAAMDAGCEKIIVGLGGSATNDGGCGAAAALGVMFFDQQGNPFVPTGGTLSRIARVDSSPCLKAIGNTKIVTMCDIDNPLCGPTGAAAVFGPQKGADEAMVQALDAGLAHLAEIIAAEKGQDNAGLPGTGAAGGMGFGMISFFNSTLQMGIETVLDTVGFDTLAQGMDYIITGEGKLDTQSLRGKVVLGVAARAKKLGIPLIAVVGDIGEGIESVYDRGVSAVFSINRVAVPFSQARLRSREDLFLTMDNLMRFIRSVKG